MVPAALLVLEVPDNRNNFSAATSWWLFLFASFYLLTRKRVYILLHAQLFIQLILLQLVCIIFLYRLFVTPYRVYIIPSAPKMPVPVLVFKLANWSNIIRLPFSLSIPMNLLTLIFGGIVTNIRGFIKWTHKYIHTKQSNFIYDKLTPTCLF